MNRICRTAKINKHTNHNERYNVEQKEKNDEINPKKYLRLPKLYLFSAHYEPCLSDICKQTNKCARRHDASSKGVPRTFFVMNDWQPSFGGLLGV